MDKKLNEAVAALRPQMVAALQRLGGGYGG